MKHSFLILLGLSVSMVAAHAREGLGISSWAGWKPGQISRADCPELRSVPLILKWNELEPKPGKYKFDKQLGEPLMVAKADDLYITLMIWVGPACPDWIYEQGVPLVITDRKVNALGQKTDGQKTYPYYLHPEYKNRFMGLIDAFGEYVNDLSPELRERIVFVQCAEGSTGDGQPYKGNALEAKYDISKDVWNDFRLETWKRYRNAVPGIPVLVNSDANGGLETEWLLENMDVIALKHGMFSHGYHVSDNVERLANFQTLEGAVKERGKSVLTRGEMDGELFVMGWSKGNIPRALYWSGLFASHCRLDIWNVPREALKDPANWPACKIFNKYAGHTDPATAPAAFCALRDGLDASDFARFPAEQFGGKPGKKSDQERYLKIAEAYSKQGARMDDPEKATGGGMLNRKRSGSNDVGWGIWPGNYCRFLTQVEPGSGDVGRWNIDDSIYGRFARAFDHKAGKTQMRFMLDNAFNAASANVKVTYLDKGCGEWSLLAGQKNALNVQNTDSGLWKEVLVTVSGPELSKANLKLRHEKGDDTTFHMIEIERIK
ncbi:hypothetical protein [Pontiella sulfatireligans]|uniref:Glycoside hydrolase family 42 N-terminal domain-containing protein n=1 Tax=Pontiella sulfatireligans TaxID=2750658 RepID=A0A6C2UMW1_9BACT|nr:hypothetical protein [Pontiella sulfatireligans]VGO20707.1 hypothetical protein SCARR_02774 [Pontiella sulfatireligans]